MAKVKVCGLVSNEDALILNDNGVDYGGIVLFYPKSKRNCSIHVAEQIIHALDTSIQKVAVTVSPSLEQVKEIAAAGFDFIQIHGDMSREVLEYIQRDRNAFNLKIFRAFNCSNENSIAGIEEDRSSIIGYVADGKQSGSGEVFDWKILNNFQVKGKLLMLAGGLNVNNVEDAMRQVRPDIVDVSTGVEAENGIGKDASKVREFVRKVRNYE